MFFGVVLAGVIGLEDTGETIAVPLLATQILWINLLTDGAPALALGIDPPPDDVMERPPRRLTDRVIDAEMWIGIVWVGAVMAAVTLLALDLRLAGRNRRRLRQRRRGADDGLHHARPRPAVQLLQRPLRPHAAPSTACSPTASSGRAIALSALLQVAVVQLPFLNDAFDTTPLGVDDWLICIGLASVVLWADEAKKLLQRRLRHPTGVDAGHATSGLHAEPRPQR